MPLYKQLKKIIYVKRTIKVKIKKKKGMINSLRQRSSKNATEFVVQWSSAAGQVIGT